VVKNPPSVDVGGGLPGGTVKGIVETAWVSTNGTAGEVPWSIVVGAGTKSSPTADAVEGLFGGNADWFTVAD